MRGLAVVLMLGVVAVAHPASACDGAEKSPRFVTAGPLPSNAAGALWWNGRWADLVACGPAQGCKPRLPDPAVFAIEPLPEGTPLEVVVEPVLASADRDGGLRTDAFLVRTKAPLKPGRYRFRGPPPTKPIALEVKATPLTTEPAAMTVGSAARGPVRAAPPSPEGAMVRELSAALPDSAKAFAGALAWETTVDGKRWRERTKRCEYAVPQYPLAGAGRERLAMSCGAEGADALLRSGQTHRVRMRAFLPGTAVDFVAEESVVLTCPSKSASKPSGAAGGCGVAAPVPRARWGWLLALAALGVRRRS